jgi:N6-adenosine-specific RNA methylase IME4/ParB-like chromosome segregation protein Spo0J
MSDTEYGDLLKDIKQNGILQPIDITYESVILDGHHRLRAAKELGIKDVGVRIPELIDISEDEYLISVALNRRHLSEGHEAVLANEYRKVISKEAESKAGMKANEVRWHGNESDSANVSESDKEKEETDTRKLAAEHMHVSEWKVREVQGIEKKAETEPTAKDVYEKLRSGNLEIHEARLIMKQPEPLRQVILQKKEEEPRKDIRVIAREISTASRNSNPPPIPQGKFSIIYADPPWEYEHEISINREIENKYPTMQLDRIKEINVPAADDAVLFLWVTVPKLEEGLSVMKAWGFNYRTGIVWVKNAIGMGYYVRQQHELLLLGVKGQGIGVPLPENRPSSVINSPREEHSRKPDAVHEIIEKMYPNHTRIELFARERREGWEAWGNELRQIH